MPTDRQGVGGQHAVDRKDQRYVRKSRELKGRVGLVNGDIPEDWPEKLMDHMWACPGCGMRNDSRHLSCRYCQTLKWGVCP